MVHVANSRLYEEQQAILGRFRPRDGNETKTTDYCVLAHVLVCEGLRRQLPDGLSQYERRENGTLFRTLAAHKSNARCASLGIHQYLVRHVAGLIASLHDIRRREQTVEQAFQSSVFMSPGGAHLVFFNVLSVASRRSYEQCFPFRRRYRLRLPRTPRDACNSMFSKFELRTKASLCSLPRKLNEYIRIFKSLRSSSGLTAVSKTRFYIDSPSNPDRNEELPDRRLMRVRVRRAGVASGGMEIPAHVTEQ